MWFCCGTFFVVCGTYFSLYSDDPFIEEEQAIVCKVVVLFKAMISIVAFA